MVYQLDLPLLRYYIPYMKIAITGHAGGLGAALASTFEEHGHSIQGFSIPEYDISVYDDQCRITHEAADADVFINCAYNRDYRGIEQVHLFTEMYGRWKKQNKHIINIGSIAPTYVPTVLGPNAQLYRAGKAALDAASDQAAILSNPCRVTNIRPDWIDSATTDELRKEGRNLGPLLDYEHVAELVYHVVAISEIMTITSITLKGTVK